MSNGLIVNGGFKLHGDFEIQGSKNESFGVICAALLTNDDVIINNVPDIVDFYSLLKIFDLLCVDVAKLDCNKYKFNASNVKKLDDVNINIFRSCLQSLRGGILVMGPLLARFGNAIIPIPGGDKIGRRRLDTHFLGIQKLGVEYSYDSNIQAYVCKSRNKKLQGNYILLDESSVTGTANIILASVLADGTTTIYNAACEPHIQQLCKMLNNMGAKISGIGSNMLIIDGVDKLHGVEHNIESDIIEIGSMIGLAAMTESDLTLKCSNLQPLSLGPVLSRFRKLGIKIDVEGTNVHIPSQHTYEIESELNPSSIVRIDDAIWPGFPTDLLCVLLVTAIQAKGSVLIHEKMFESRLFFVDNLIEMGAKIILCDPHRAHVIGINREYNLHSIGVNSPDIRTGMSLLIAALSADGKSKIGNLNIIKRGYQDIVNRLLKIGAHVEEIN